MYPSSVSFSKYLGLEELPGRTVHAGTFRQYAEHRCHTLLQPVGLKEGFCHCDMFPMEDGGILHTSPNSSANKLFQRGHAAVS